MNLTQKGNHMHESPLPGITARELVLGIVELASPPEIYTRVSKLVEQDHASTEVIAQTVQQDPALTARLLHLVNSAFYGFPSQVSTVSRAITLVGTRELKELVLATSVLEMFRGIPNDLIDMHVFWRNSIRCAALCRVFASFHQTPRIESIFTAGMLHDIGHLIIYSKMPELARKALLEQRYQSHEIYEIESALWGFDYAQVGGELAERWKLPFFLRETIGLHTDPGLAVEHGVSTAIVNISSRIARSDLHTRKDIEQRIPVHSPVWKQSGVPPERLDEALETAEQQLQESMNLIKGDY